MRIYTSKKVRSSPVRLSRPKDLSDSKYIEYNTSDERFRYFIENWAPGPASSGSRNLVFSDIRICRELVKPTWLRSKVLVTVLVQFQSDALCRLVVKRFNTTGLDPVSPRRLRMQVRILPGLLLARGDGLLQVYNPIQKAHGFDRVRISASRVARAGD